MQRVNIYPHTSEGGTTNKQKYKKQEGTEEALNYAHGAAMA